MTSSDLHRMAHSGAMESEERWTVIRKDYPALSELTYLDTASCGPLARSTTKVAMQEQELLMREASVRYGQWREEGSVAMQRMVAGSINGEAKNLALMPNFSVGMALLASLLGHRPKVLLVGGDYPTLHAPFTTKDLQPVLIHPQADGSIPVNAIAQAVERERPQLVAISHVQWATGWKADLHAVAALCRAHGAWSVIDATQSWCCAPIDVRAMGIDILGASGYKWPLAGFGNGFMHLSAAVRAEITERSGVDPVTRLTGGHTDPAAFMRLGDALERYQAHGPEAIAKRVDLLCDHAVNALDAAGVRVLNGRDPMQRAGILMIEGDRHRLSKLHGHGVQVAMRGKGIRLGVHFYNTTEDLDRLVEALKA
jgi:selenocysteine lyase/cysteine desulfurase